MTFGKVMGGGMPAAAFGGKAEIMAQLAPAGPVYQAGTLAGNPVAATAGLETLRRCTPTVYEHLNATSNTIGQAASAELTKAGVANRLQVAGNLFSIFFTPNEVTDYDSARTQRVEQYTAFFHAMLSQGVYLPPSAYEAWFVSAAHDAAAVEQVLAALPEAARAAAAVSV
jgi:glutamate-1-semialdehyde 2,1-aminomutase